MLGSGAKSWSFLYGVDVLNMPEAIWKVNRSDKVSQSKVNVTLSNLLKNILKDK